MPIRLDEPKRVAVRELAPGHPLRELLLGLPDPVEEAAFDLLVPAILSLARTRTERE